jgi:dolichol-phosphate mannosyltransferase
MRPFVPGEVELSVVVPTLNEAANLPFLAQRIGGALRGQAYEVLIIDDGSDDDTPAVCERLRERYPVFLHVRREARNGLAGAVVYGMSRARGEYLVVMDADLQHPPEQIPELVKPLECGEAEFVIGSRYVEGGKTDQKWGPLRRVNSLLATVLSRPLVGRTRDPMSGFFAVRAETFFRAENLEPVGYKIALELLCKCRVRRVREVPIRFGLRQTGTSKLNVRQRLHFLDHLSRLYDHCYPRAAAWAKWAIVNGCGWLIAFGLYMRLVARDMNPALAPSVAFAGILIANTIFQIRATRLRGGRSRDWADFGLVALIQWSVCTLSARWIANHAIHATVTELFAITFGVAAIAGSTIKAQLKSSTCPDVEEIEAPSANEKPAIRHAA